MNLPGEAPTWVSSIVRDDIRPAPAFDVRSFDVGGGKVAIVRVDPLATPPAITRGTIYERVSGQTVPVREPLGLADLYQRGNAARERAERTATQAAFDVSVHGTNTRDYLPRHLQIALAVAATGNPPDISSRLFTRAFAAAVETTLRTTVGGGPSPTIAVRPTQEAVIGDMRGNDPRISGCALALARWDGSVAVYRVQAVEDTNIDSVTNVFIRDAWQAAADLADALGSNGPGWLVLRVGGAMFPPHADSSLLPRLARGPVDLAVDDELLASIGRELNRVAGYGAFED